MTESENIVPPVESQVNISPKDVARFWAKVKRGADDECWLWQASKVSGGYGQFRLRGQFISAHRFAWIVTFGAIPDGLYVCHHCNQRACGNPNHYFLGTAQDNSDDMVAKGRQATGKRNGRYTHPERTARGDRHGARLHPERYRGERNGNAKLTEDQVIEIRTLYAAGKISQRRLAANFGVTKTAIRFIVIRKSWPLVA